MRFSPIISVVLASIPLSLPSCQKRKEKEHEEPQKVVVTSPLAKDVVVTQPYVCQIRAQRHIEVRAQAKGYLDDIRVREGQMVKQGDLMFKILPVLYEAKFATETAEAKLAQLEFTFTKSLERDKVVSKAQSMLQEARRDAAKAKAALAGAELDFTRVTARYDGIVDRLYEMLGSLVDEGDMLTTLSDNSVMWVYFNMPEKDYLQYMAYLGQNTANPDLQKLAQQIELKLADGTIFPQPCQNVVIEAQFNPETGNIAFRADFPNPNRLLRHGQTGTILIHRTSKDAVVIPQRAVFDLLDKRYVWIIDENKVAHRGLITIKNELEDIFVIDKGLNVKDKIVLEGVRLVEDGQTVEYEFRTPEEALKNPKFHAE